jgi:hypothetical protein
VYGLLWNAGLVGSCFTRAHDVSASVAAPVDGRFSGERSDLMTSAFGTRVGGRGWLHDRRSLQESFRYLRETYLGFPWVHISCVIRFGALEDKSVKHHPAVRLENYGQRRFQGCAEI